MMMDGTGKNDDTNRRTPGSILYTYIYRFAG